MESIPPELGSPTAGALDAGYFSAANVALLESRSIDPYIATGRVPRQQSLPGLLAEPPPAPPATASPKELMVYKLKTELGQAIYAARKYTVEPVFGIIKEVLGFRQFSLRGLEAVTGEWTLVCLAFNLKRLHRLTCSQA